MAEMHDFFMETAIRLGQKSKCVSKQVGCLIVKDNRIISMGYNGTPAGFKYNCCEVFVPENFDRAIHHKWSQIHEVHAEMNALTYAAKWGISVDGSTMYCSLYPCDHCLKNIVDSGIKKIFYRDEYDFSSEDNKELMTFIRSKVEIIKYEE